VTHNGPIRAIQAHALGIPYTEYRQTAKSIKKGSVSAVSLEDGSWSRLDYVLGGLPAYVLSVSQPAAEWASPLLVLESVLG
jgi:broad specificity phosphatase PhoE